MQRSSGPSRPANSSAHIRPTRLALSSGQPQTPRSQPWGGTWILVVLLLTIFEGAIRKWFIAGIPALRYPVYFSKDIVFVLAALAGMSKARSMGKVVGILLTTSLIALGMPTLINLPSTTAIGGILSLRAYLVLPMCAFAAGFTLHSLRDPDRIVVAVGISAILVAAVGLVQFRLPPSHFLNRYETDEAVHIVAEFNHVRATGTFAFITGMGMMTGVTGWAGIYLFLSSRTLFGRSLATAVLFAGLCCGMVSMSRGGLVLYGATVVGGLILFGGARESFYLLLVFVIGYWVFGGGATSEEASEGGVQEATIRRFTEHDSPAERLGYALSNVQMGLFRHPFGEGLGRGQVGGNYAESGKRTWGGGYESELGRIAFEVGPLGWFGVIVWRVAMIVLIWRALRRAKDRKVRALLAASLPLFTLMSTNYMAFNHTASSFAWAIATLALGTAALSPNPPNTSLVVERIPRRRAIA